nr:hypothetical protein [Tanacetum cinerariifolium]
IEHKKQKKGIEMYYPRFTKVAIHHFMSKDLSIPRQNKINWHYVRDDNIFSTIKVVSRHQDTQQYGAILPIELTNEDIRNTTAYKEYYAYTTGVAAPKPKASARKKRGDSNTSLTPPIATPTTTAAPIPRLSAAAKDEGTGFRPGVPDVPSDDSEEELSDVDVQDEGDKNDESDDGSDDGNDDDNDETVKDGSKRDDDDDNDNDDEEELAKIDEPKDTESGRGGDEVTKRSEDEGNDNEDQYLRLSEEARIQEEEEADELYRDVDINQGRGLQLSQNIEDSHVTLTPVHPDGLQESSSVSSFVTSMLNPISDAGVESIFTTASSPIVSLQTPTPIMTHSTIDTITTSSDTPIPPTTIPSTILKIFLPLTRIEESVNTTLEAEVLTRSSHSSRTSYAVAADLSEMELKKILIEKMEGNKSIQRSDEQRNLYKALVEAYDADKTILDTYRESTILKRRREDGDHEGPSAGSDRGSKRRREGGEHASASTPSETATRTFRFDERLRSLETSFFEYRQTNSFVDAVSAILGIVHQYMTQQMMEAVQEAVQIQTDRLQDSLQRENDEFLRNIDENMKKIIKGQVKNQVKEQVSRILPRIEESVNATLEAEVLTRSSHSSRTSYAIAADLSEMELKNILIEKMKGNKSIQRSDEQRNLYKALVEAYDADKAILDTYGDSTILK